MESESETSADWAPVLRSQITAHFSLDELEGIAFDLGVDWDELSGNTKSLKTLSLIRLIGRNHRLPELVDNLKAERPVVDWPKVPSSIFVSSTKSQRIRQALIEKVRAYWIDGVLDQGLYGVARIELGLSYAPEAVELPWMMTLQIPQREPENIPHGTRLTELLKRTRGQMLILGEPGSGKTTLLLELARDLLDSAEFDEDRPIPVVLNLSTWALSQSPLEEWLLEELSHTYQIKPAYSRSWLEEEPFTLLLDGLDEVDREKRPACVQAINLFRQSYGLTDLVVCSRTTDYREQSSRLQLLGAVALEPLSRSDVDVYLEAAGKQLESVRRAIAEDHILQELANSPLMLSIIALAFRGKPADKLKVGSLAARRHRALSTYVERMLNRPSITESHNPRGHLKSLVWIAHNMIQHGQASFYIENLQPDWLSDESDRWMYRMASGLSLALLMVMPIAATAGVLADPLPGTLVWVATVLVVLPILVLLRWNQDIRMVEYVGFTWPKILISLLLILGAFLILLVVNRVADDTPFKTPFALFWSTRPTFLSLRSAIVLITFLLVLPAVYYLITGWLKEALSINEMVKKATPGQGIWLSLRNGIISCTMLILLFGLMGLVLGYTIELLYQARVYPLVVSARFLGWLGASLGFALAIWTGGLRAVAEHLTLRMIFAARKKLPTETVSFLEEMKRRVLLRRVGGGYVFVHRAILEYLAYLED